MHKEPKMRGFVDSSMMTDSQVQRLGWEDDPGPSRYNIRRQIDRSGGARHDAKIFASDDVWAAAAHAHRVNSGEYLKNPVYKVNEQGLTTGEVIRHRNRYLMDQALENQAMITDADRELGAKARNYHSRVLTFRSLKNALNDFQMRLVRALSMTEFQLRRDSMELSVIASQIQTYESGVQLDQVMDGINTAPIDAIGAKVDIQITVIKSVFSQTYEVYFITAVSEDRHAVFFSYRERLPNGHQCRIRGTVKAHRENSTQLNRVKVL